MRKIFSEKFLRIDWIDDSEFLPIGTEPEALFNFFLPYLQPGKSEAVEVDEVIIERIIEEHCYPGAEDAVVCTMECVEKLKEYINDLHR